MDFGAVVAYCKGWYVKSSNELDYWKDLAYCIEADGWSVFSKKDVVRWILNRFNQEEAFFKKVNNNFGISWFYNELEQQMRYWSFAHKEELSLDDAVIFMFISIVGISNTDLFDKTYKPTEKILPFDVSITLVEQVFFLNKVQDLSHFDKDYISKKIVA